MTELTTTFSSAADTLKSNPMTATLVGLWGAGLLTFVTKDIPSRLLRFFGQIVTTTLVVGIPTREIVSLTQWIAGRKLAKRSRSFHLQEQSLTLAEGISFVVYRGRLCWIRRAKEPQQHEATKKSKSDSDTSVAKKNSFWS